MALLEVSTDDAGVEESGIFNFVVNAIVFEDGGPESTATFKQQINNYIDSSVTTLILNNLMPGATYEFDLKVQNRFGCSRVSETRLLKIRTSTIEGTL